ncbi:MAG: hypothetical protein IBJ11_09040 [Phycisphaerales bacterium]|nr:hypothetical protein [Phycisphaerales bacterium]
MRLSDAVSALQVSWAAQAALLLFLAAFGAIMLRTFAGPRRADHRRAAALPLDDGSIPSSPPPPPPAGAHPRTDVPSLRPATACPDEAPHAAP